MSYYGTYNGTGYNVTYVEDSQAGYAALTCSQVSAVDGCVYEAPLLSTSPPCEKGFWIALRLAMSSCLALGYQ